MFDVVADGGGLVDNEGVRLLLPTKERLPNRNEMNGLLDGIMKECC